MFDLLIRQVMEPAEGRTLGPEVSVLAAAQCMAQHETGALMVVERGQLLGVFTERDALFRVLARGLDAQATPLQQVMTRNPFTLGPDRSYGHALVLMQENGFRHVPVVEHGRPIGMVSARNAMDPELEEFSSEALRRRHLRDGR